MLIKGKITDYNGEPISLASVVIRDSNPLIGVYTNIDGNYAINVNAGQTLQFSHVGTKQVVERTIAKTDTVVDISMMNELLLNEVVVIGKKPTNYIWWLVAGLAAFSLYKIIKTKNTPKKITI